ncbi:MAG: hypothetical protein RL136_958 [Planctomycetota bacterium]|jgi:hypothetical protein
MTAFQIILLSSLGAIALTIVALMLRGAVGRIAGALWLLVLFAGMVFAIKPNLTTTIANALGISRGTDLLLYLLVLAVLYGFLLIYLKLRRVRRELTLLVREIAIREASRTTDDHARAQDDADREASS